jgi:hypothetical protein
MANSVLWWRAGEVKPEARALQEMIADDVAGRTVIFKMHGSVRPDLAAADDYVITEEDYVEFLSRMTASTAIPRFFLERCEGASFLFLGYGLRDWNLRVVLKNLDKRFGRRSGGNVGAGGKPVRSWAIQRHPSEVEALLWANRGVTIFDMDLDDFVARMKNAAPRAKEARIAP